MHAKHDLSFYQKGNLSVFGNRVLRKPHVRYWGSALDYTLPSSGF